MTGPTYLLPDLAERFGLELQGTATGVITGVDTLMVREALPCPLDRSNVAGTSGRIRLSGSCPREPRPLPSS